MRPEPGSIRPGLRWLLAGALTLTAWAVWWSRQPPSQSVVEAVTSVGFGQGSQATHLPIPVNSNSDLPARWIVPAFERAGFDPFVGVVPRPAAPPKPPPVVVAPARPAAPMLAQPPIRQPPPQNYRYLGQLVDPAGRQWLYLARGDVPLTVTVGTQLEEGYVVEAIDAEGVRLLYPPLDARVVIPVPPARQAPTQ